MQGGLRTGKLTKVGQQLAYDVGLALRNDYITQQSFISRLHDQSEIRYVLLAYYCLVLCTKKQ